MLDLMSADPAPAAAGFSWLNLVVLLVIAAVAYPLYRVIRERISRSRRERWAREEEQQIRYTEANDPDLRRDDGPSPR